MTVLEQKNFAGAANAFGGRKVIDVDAHLTEPHDLWTRLAPAAIRDRVPQVKTINGERSWVIDGDIIIGKGELCLDRIQNQFLGHIRAIHLYDAVLSQRNDDRRLGLQRNSGF